MTTYENYEYLEESIFYICSLDNNCDCDDCINNEQLNVKYQELEIEFEIELELELDDQEDFEDLGLFEELKSFVAEVFNIFG